MKGFFVLKRVLPWTDGLFRDNDVIRKEGCGVGNVEDLQQMMGEN